MYTIFSTFVEEVFAKVESLEVVAPVLFPSWLQEIAATDIATPKVTFDNVENILLIVYLITRFNKNKPTIKKLHLVFSTAKI